MATKDADLNRWKTLALAVPLEEVRARPVPLHVVFGEAVDVVRFAESYWKEAKDDDGRVVRPGLASVGAKKGAAGGGRVTAKTSEEILSLARAAQAAQTAYLLAVEVKTGVDPLARGRFLVGEIGATLEWYFDDGVTDRSDAQLASVVAAHADDPETADALASALDDFAGLAEPHAKALDGLGGFDAKLIAEARALAVELRARPTQPLAPTKTARDALALRDGLVSLLLDRMALVRSAARFVFRAQPEIARLATSAYERRRRAALRKGKEPAADAGSQADGGAPAGASDGGAGAATPAGG